MGQQFDPASYKEELKKVWNEKAEAYHERFASKKVGPFKSLENLIAAGRLKKGDRVLDVGTGTGIVAMDAAALVGEEGSVVGIDIATGPLGVARRVSAGIKNLSFAEMDAERLDFPDGSFDAVLCEFALMFFPDTRKALSEMRRVLSSGGRLAISVHGSAENVPYFSVIMSSLLKHVPDIIPPGRPSPVRFGDPALLRAELAGAGFREIDVTAYTYMYGAGTFEEYVQEYLESAGSALRAKITNLDKDLYATIKQEAEANTRRFTKNGKIEFPWQVLVASARS